jgi:hypothetical protein
MLMCVDIFAALYCRGAVCLRQDICLPIILLLLSGGVTWGVPGVCWVDSRVRPAACRVVCRFCPVMMMIFYCSFRNKI